MEEDEIMEQLPNLECAQWLFLLSVEEAPRKKEEVLEKLMTKIKEDSEEVLCCVFSFYHPQICCHFIFMYAKN